MSNVNPPRKINPALLLGSAKRTEQAPDPVGDFAPRQAAVRATQPTAGTVDSSEKVRPATSAPARRFPKPTAPTPIDGFSSRPAVHRVEAQAPATRPAVKPAPTAAEPGSKAPEVSAPAVKRPTGMAGAGGASTDSGTARRINSRFADPTPKTTASEGARKALSNAGADVPSGAPKLPVQNPNRVRRVATSAQMASRFTLRDAGAEAAEKRAEEQALQLRNVLRGEGGRFQSTNEEDGEAQATGGGKPQFLSRAGKPRYVRPSTVRGAANISVEEWTDDRSTDSEYGLTSERDTYNKKPKVGKGALKITERDIIMVKFLARYRYANALQLARLTDASPANIMTRLNKLEESGFVRKQAVSARQYLWITTKAGNLLVDSIFQPIKKGTISYATIAHTLGLSELGVELEREAGGKDILGAKVNGDVDEVPENRWKFGIWGHEKGKTLGEMTVTEREIRQGQMRWRGNRSTLELREVVDLAVDSAEAAPELEEGNEGLFVVYGANGQDGEHIPDLVVARERAEDGSVRHIAIELELTAKPLPSWKRILRWYRDNGVMFDKVVYFTPKPSIANALRKADQDVGLGEDRLIIRKYIPEHNRTPFYG